MYILFSLQLQPPEDVLTSVPVPSTDSIHFHSLVPYCNIPGRNSASNPRFPLKELHCQFQLDDMSTNFARVSAVSNFICFKFSYFITLYELDLLWLNVGVRLSHYYCQGFSFSFSFFLLFIDATTFGHC